MGKLDVKAVGISVGIIWSLSVLILGLMAMWFGWGMAVAEILSSMYIGYEPTILGCVIGGLWGFADACIGGLVAAWLYNIISK